MGVSSHSFLRGLELRRATQTPSARVRAATRLRYRPAGSQPCEARDLPRPSALLRDPSARRWLRHPDHTGTARSQRRQHDHDLHARAQSWRVWGSEPAGRAWIRGSGILGLAYVIEIFRLDIL